MQSIQPVLLLAAMILLGLSLRGQQYNYRYADGNGDSYTIYSFQLIYGPVQPQESSSGTYSGGKPMIKSLKKGEYRSLEKLLRQAIAAVSEHTSGRPMGSGTITLHNKETNEDNSWVLKPGSSFILKIEKRLGILLR